MRYYTIWHNDRGSEPFQGTISRSQLLQGPRTYHRDRPLHLFTLERLRSGDGRPCAADDRMLAPSEMDRSSYSIREDCTRTGTTRWYALDPWALPLDPPESPRRAERGRRRLRHLKTVERMMRNISEHVVSDDGTVSMTAWSAAAAALQ